MISGFAGVCHAAPSCAPSLMASSQDGRLLPMSITVAALELIPETSAAEQLVADAYAIDASIEDAARVRDCVAL